jgi:hypothetical protein
MQTRRLVNAIFPSARLVVLLLAGWWGPAAYGGPLPPPSGIDQPVLVNGEEIGFSTSGA